MSVTSTWGSQVPFVHPPGPQAWPQRPQFVGSTVASTQAPPHEMSPPLHWMHSPPSQGGACSAGGGAARRLGAGRSRRPAHPASPNAITTRARPLFIALLDHAGTRLSRRTETTSGHGLAHRYHVPEDPLVRIGPRSVPVWADAGTRWDVWTRDPHPAGPDVATSRPMARAVDTGGLASLVALALALPGCLGVSGLGPEPPLDAGGAVAEPPPAGDTGDETPRPPLEEATSGVVGEAFPRCPAGMSYCAAMAACVPRCSTGCMNMPVACTGCAAVNPLAADDAPVPLSLCVPEAAPTGCLVPGLIDRCPCSPAVACPGPSQICTAQGCAACGEPGTDKASCDGGGKCHAKGGGPNAFTCH